MSILINLEQIHRLKPVKMAEALGISKSYYSMIRNGDRPISKSIAIRLKDSFGIKLDDSLCPSVHGRETNCVDPKPQAS